jgi:hypothetical protein
MEVEINRGSTVPTFFISQDRAPKTLLYLHPWVAWLHPPRGGVCLCSRVMFTESLVRESGGPPFCLSLGRGAFCLMKIEKPFTLSFALIKYSTWNRLRKRETKRERERWERERGRERKLHSSEGWKREKGSERTEEK